MYNEKATLEEGGDEFQELKEQVLTYAFSEQIPATPINKNRRNNKNKTLEKHRLQLLVHDRNNHKDFDIKQANKNLKRIEGEIGKILPIGQVTFKSNFQCGNISNVRLIACNTYEIQLQKQTNSNRISAWFYFSVEGIKGEAHFVIKGFTKSSSLYNQGMKVCYRDVKELSKWRRGGSRISYTNSIQNQEYQNTYELRFSHFFKNNDHTCIQFAYCFPYGLKKLYNLIHHIKDQTGYQVLAKSFRGLEIPLLTIGNQESKEVIILSARVHPGETVSSFIMQGFLKELVGDNQYGKMLRSRYLFKVVPMLNPDGVTKGNYRFSGYGCDLNRKWKACKQNNQPQIYFMRQLIKSMNKDRKVTMFIDMHGHSRKKNVFFYGCCERGESNDLVNAKPKQFPYLMEKIHDAFKYENCCFNIQKDKEGTARVAVWKQLKIDYVYTLESSFCGSQFGVNYLESDYEKIGRKLCEGIAIFFYSSIEKQMNQNEYKAIEKLTNLKEKAFTQLMANPNLLHVGDEDDSGSQSEPQAGEIPQKQRSPENGLPKPQSFLKDLKAQHKSKKLNFSKKFFSQSSINDRKIENKLKSEVSLGEELNRTKKAQKINLQQDSIPEQAIRISNPSKFDKVQIKIANSVNTFELQSLRASALYQKNVRVHSLTKNTDKLASRSKRIVNPFSQQLQTHEERQRLKINLMHGREGVQYRRVRKVAEQNLKKQVNLNTQYENKIVKELLGNQFYIGQSQRSYHEANTTMAPRFYYSSQQKHRKASADVSFKKSNRNDDFKKISINGDEFSVRCKGNHIYF